MIQIFVSSSQVIPGNDQNKSPTNQKTAGSKLERGFLDIFSRQFVALQQKQYEWQTTQQVFARKMLKKPSSKLLRWFLIRGTNNYQNETSHTTIARLSIIRKLQILSGHGDSSQWKMAMFSNSFSKKEQKARFLLNFCWFHGKMKKTHIAYWGHFQHNDIFSNFASYCRLWMRISLTLVHCVDTTDFGHIWISCSNNFVLSSFRITSVSFHCLSTPILKRNQKLSMSTARQMFWDSFLPKSLDTSLLHNGLNQSFIKK